MKGCQYLLLNIIINCPMLVGYTTLNIDLKQRRLNISQTWRIYAILDDMLVLVIIPIATAVNFQHMRFENRNQVIAFANAVIIITRLLLILEVVLQRGKRESALMKCLTQVLVLQTSYFDRFHHVHGDKRLRKWIYVNAVLMIVHSTNIFVKAWMGLANGGWWNYMDMYGACVVLVMQHSTMVQHASLLCFTFESISKLNYQLMENIQDSKLSLIYYHLINLIQELNIIYSPLNLWIQLCSITTNSMMGLYYVSLVMFPHKITESFTYLMLDDSYFLLCFLMHLYSWICNHVKMTFRKTSAILKKYLFKYYEQKKIELLFLNCDLQKNSVNIFRMFNIDLTFLFSLTSQLCLNIIILIQSDMQNNG
ncbi:uncharacterized protein ACRADG_010506 [Cochliomyia hominivorax]